MAERCQSISPVCDGPVASGTLSLCCRSHVDVPHPPSFSLAFGRPENGSLSPAVSRGRGSRSVEGGSPLPEQVRRSLTLAAEWRKDLTHMSQSCCSGKEPS